MGRQQEWAYHVEPEEFPRDFPERLDRFGEAGGLTWRELTRRLNINARSVETLEGAGRWARSVEGIRSAALALSLTQVPRHRLLSIWSAL